MNSTPERDSSVDLSGVRAALERGDGAAAAVMSRSRRVLARVEGFVSTGSYPRVIASEAVAVLGGRRHASSQGRKSVLIVEDDGDYGRRIGTMMSRALGAEVTIVPTVRAAEAALTSARYDLLIADVDLPDGLGVEVLERARVIDPSLPTMVMSAVVPGQLEDIRVRVRAAAKFPKTEDPQVLVETARRLMTFPLGLAAADPTQAPAAPALTHGALAAGAR